MKLKNKLLTILAPVATIAVLTPTIALTSCGGGDSKGENHVTYSGKTTLTITSAGTTLEFTLAKALGSDERLEIAFPEMPTGDLPEVSISKIDATKITVSLKLASTGASHSKFGLKFNCFNNSSKITPIWSSTIPGFDVTKTN